MAVTKVPTKKKVIQPWQKAGFSTQKAYQASPQYQNRPKVTGGQAGAVTFKPQQVKFGVAPKDDPNIYSKEGYRQYSRGGQQYGNAPKTPVEFNANADLNTVQGNIDAGYIQWTPALGKMGYKPPPRAPGSIDIAGYHPGGPGEGDVLGDWEYQAAQGDVDAADRADSAAALENIEALAVGWGGDLSNMVGQGLISQKAADAAKANQFSTMSELGRQLSQGTGQAQAQLAARGILSSGALPGMEGELNRQYQQQTNTGLLDLMSKVKSIRSEQAQAAAGRRMGLMDVRANVLNRLSQMERFQPIPDQTAFWDNSRQAYIDDWGRAYDRNGKKLN